MKKVLVIGGMSAGESDRSSLASLHAFLQELPIDIAADATFLDKLVFSIAPDHVDIFDTTHQKRLGDYDLVFLRGSGINLNYSAFSHYVSRACKLFGIPCINDYTVRYPGTKIAQGYIFREHNVRFPHTLYSIDNQLLVDQAAETFGYPYILKPDTGSYGDSNHLVKDAQHAQKILTVEPGVDFIAQAFCPNVCDYRVLIVGDETLIFERRGVDGSHLNNTSKGGQAAAVELTSLPAEILESSREISRALGLTIAGVDVMPNSETGEYVFLEVNSQPQLRSGALLDEKRELIARLIDKI